MNEPDTQEDRLLAWLAARGPAAGGVLALGIGDDAAVFRADGRWVATTDSVVEGVHFEPGTAWRDVGYKAMARNLSDVAAMGCRPELALDGLALGPGLSEGDAREIVLGLEEAAAPFGTAICGGDVASSPGPTMVSVTILGRDVCGRVLLRSGAMPGDEIWVTGAFGGSILGRHLRPAPRVDLALAASRLLPVTAAIDVSDGLAKDLWRLSAASGRGIRLEAARIPIHADAVRLAGRTGRDPLEHALGDGEDFELAIAIRPDHGDGLLRAADETGTPVARIGVVLGSGPGLEIERPDGRVAPLPPTGHGHEWTRSV